MKGAKYESGTKQKWQTSSPKRLRGVHFGGDHRVSEHPGPRFLQPTRVARGLRPTLRLRCGIGRWRSGVTSKYRAPRQSGRGGTRTAASQPMRTEGRWAGLLLPSEACPAPSRYLPRLSCLSTPGSNEKFLCQAPTVPADMTFLARGRRCALVRMGAGPRWSRPSRTAVDYRVLCGRSQRVGHRPEWKYGERHGVVGNAGERSTSSCCPRSVGRRGSCALSCGCAGREIVPAGRAHRDRAHLETAPGLSPSDEIVLPRAPARHHLRSPADFCPSIEMPVLTAHRLPEYPGLPLQLRFIRLPHGGRANGLPVIDGQFLKVARARFAARVLHAPRMLGYDCKWALTPTRCRAHESLADLRSSSTAPTTPRCLPQGHREDPQGCVDVRRRDDRRGQTADRLKFVSRCAPPPADPQRL